ncbi:D-hexose-6-phosphate mutarotase [Kineosporia rhizophila]|uniref:D-hexose-6-phosphate mutarotase n=1 Tax=Kineosporia TaxID=49184 RepID=UPI001E468B32|nr:MULTISPECIES: D-hexose-6-phosphate mutarotase [Kineosporia]MCE0540157.1 D-hexose-6-phosphate mutarotase [Kineosporia rhizophila]GLY14341.1 D-hexose-6-phosphate mutarotase [Kineosporia sp. NBRC 101677]
MAIDPCSSQTLTAPDGAELVVCAHGGHVTGWTPAGGRPRLWLSPTAECGPGKAIRGGVPVIFPQFAGRGPLPKHGVARNRAWTEVESGPGTWTAKLVDDTDTRAIWPHSFELVLSARAEGQTLDLELTARNTGDAPWSFTAALHSYFTVGDPDTVISGLGGRAAADNAGGPAYTFAPAGGSVPALTSRDVSIEGASGPVALEDPELGRLLVTANGFPDRVVWNPGAGHGLGDVPDGSETGWVCIEPALLQPVELTPGSAWTGSVRFDTGRAPTDD